MTTSGTPVLLPDAYLQLTVPSFEYPRENLSSSVRFVGTPPIAANQAPLPPWAHEVDGFRKVVLVTQGTLSDHDFGELITPALAALAGEPDLLVVVTAGGRASASIPGPIPDNARLADYLPLDWLLPRLDVLVTNGGYGTLNQAISYGILVRRHQQLHQRTGKSRQRTPRGRRSLTADLRPALRRRRRRLSAAAEN